MNDEILGYCGLYCGGCPVYQNSKKEKPMKDEKGKPMLCNGCNSSITTEWCTICSIKTCNRNKGHRYCLQCGENPCTIVNDFMNQSQYPYHKEVQGNMKVLEKHGLKIWIEMNEKKYHCSKCREQVNWFEKSCQKCGEDLKRDYF